MNITSPSSIMTASVPMIIIAMFLPKVFMNILLISEWVRFKASILPYEIVLLSDEMAISKVNANSSAGFPVYGLGSVFGIFFKNI